ncbi:lipoprotein-releasing ABC transporter permease subunit [Caenispirillum bisanense]|uniref:Lipoprotein-releasing system permease protein n=1 Tax=Caenispirillum bisanense TaxID=414052 RepID=A0A286GF52_9PROT|nr:lipoprotein-releasing ABC transporter permease subunit [Caenispirillum bisanense]SOD94147.1 lipoprotein-releasing system permease protein [Caenispirillum bisanense]
MVFSAFERMMAFRYLRARRREGFVSVIAGFSLLGIALGVATLIIVMAVMNGFRQELLTRILGLNGHVTVFSNGPNFFDYEGAAGEIRGLPGVVAVTPMIEGQVMATANGQSGGAIVRGAAMENLAQRKIIADNIVQGSLADLGDEKILIGQRMAEKYGLRLGDKLSLISPKGNVTAFGTVPRVRGYEVGAIFNVGMYEYDSSFVFMPLAAAQVYFQQPEAVTHLEVVLDNADRTESAMAAIAGELGPGYRLFDWRRTNSSFFNALQVERNVMFLILTLIILVAAFNIISGLIMLVKDKGRDIAILRTMGASRGSVMRIFFMAGASVGVAGTLGGLGLGVAFAANIEEIRQFLQSLTGTELFSAEIYFLAHMPAEMDWNEVLSVVLMALGLSFGATIYPSWRAARLDPVEALRYE